MPSVHAIILASGLSRRLAGFNKLLLVCPDGKKLVEQVMSEVTQTDGFSARQLVYSHESVANAARAYGFSAVYNSEYLEGKAAGIRRAAKNAPAGGLLFMAGDQYGVNSKLLEKIITMANSGDDETDSSDVIFSRTEKGFGLPAFFSEKMRPFLTRLSGEQGGKDAVQLFEQDGGRVKITFVETESRQFLDIDTWNDYYNFLEAGGIRHIFVTGGRGEGKSTLIRAIVCALSDKKISEVKPESFENDIQGYADIDGLLLYVNRDESKTENRLYIKRIATGQKRLAAVLRKSDKFLLEFNRSIFDDFAVEQLTQAANNPANKLLILDELGRLEVNCEKFHRAVRELLENGKIRVIAALQNGDIDFNRELQNRSDAVILNAAD